MYIYIYFNMHSHAWIDWLHVGAVPIVSGVHLPEGQTMQKPEAPAFRKEGLSVSSSQGSVQQGASCRLWNPPKHERHRSFVYVCFFSLFPAGRVEEATLTTSPDLACLPFCPIWASLIFHLETCLLRARHSNTNVFLDSDQLEDLDLIFDTIRAKTKRLVQMRL